MEIAGVQKPENFAPELSRIGSKSILNSSLLPGMAAHPAGLHCRGRSNNRAHSQHTGLRMHAATALQPAQIDSLTTALLALNEHSHHPACMVGSFLPVSE